MSAIPILYLAFANHREQPLDNLALESQEVYQMLAPRMQTGCYLVHREDFAELDTIAHYLTVFKDQVRLFHYGGHAGAQSLLLRDLEARAEGIAGMLRSQQNLALVFLNGCSTRGQVAYLHELGVPAVVATSAPIDDDLAGRFAAGFYRSLAAGHTLGEAFDLAAAATEARGRRPVRFYRDLARRVPAVDDLHWGLSVREESALSWTLPDRPFFQLEALDPSRLAAAAVATLAPYLAGRTADAGAYLWPWLQQQFTSEPDRRKLEALRAQPLDLKVQGKAEGKLEEFLAEDLTLSAELAALLEALPKGEGKTNIQQITGDGNIGIQDVSGGSTIRIEKG